MKTLHAAALCLLALASGCRDAGEQKPAVVPPASVHAPKSDALDPYYYGLIEEYQTILAEDPNNLAAVIALGNAYFDSDQWREAVRMYERAVELDPRNADVITDLGTSYRNLGKPERALAEYRRALSLEPGHMNARFNLGVVYAYDLRDYARAIRLWEDMLRLAPNYPEANVLRARIAALKKVMKKEGR
jgi:tetratricopeptide (TPR) repeat protein